MNNEYQECPNCGSTEFLTVLNSYEVVSLVDGKWQIIRTELVNDDEDYVTCSECGEDVDFDISEQRGIITLRTPTP
ncbi:MAG: hypothetical protein EPO32_04005 [Anaerolineae bacterium]|nr:MAG: hypothetical protein EPO32_04005 [Anaerolineae bacterium]